MNAPAPGIHLTPGFSRSLQQLTAKRQGLVKQAVMDLMLAPCAGGARLDNLDCNERRFCSLTYIASLDDIAADAALTPVELVTAMAALTY